MKIKAFTSTIFLAGDVAVKSISDRTILDEDPIDLAIKYDNFGIDQLFILDLSRNYIEHECALGLIENIVAEVDIPVIVAGCIKNKGDLERLFDMGVSKVALNFSKDNNVDLANEIKNVYDKSKLLSAITCVDNIYNHKEIIETVTSGIVLMKDSILDDCMRSIDMDMLVPAGDISLDKLIKLLTYDCVSGVFGRFVNINLHDINSIKIVLKDSGINTTAFDAKLSWEDLTINENGLIPVIVQDYRNGDVLMMAWMNKLAFENTIKTGRMNYYSRSRQSQWIKGETSGHFQYVKSLNADCDSDTLLAQVSQVGAACHTGSRSCFFKEIIKRDFI